MKENNLFTRELSLLEFNHRVVKQAADKNIPILERLKYLCIASSNLDEFFEIKVAYLRKILDIKESSFKEKNNPNYLLYKEIRKKTILIQKEQYNLLQRSVFIALRRKGVVFLRRRELNTKQKKWLRKYFIANILPVLNPVGLDSTSPELSGCHPFPKVPNKSLNFMVKVTGSDAFGKVKKMAVVTAPRVLPRQLELPKNIFNGANKFIFLSSIIHENIDLLFPGLKVRGCHQFRVTMNSNLVFDDEDLQNIKDSLTKILPDRIYSQAIRLEVVNDCPNDIIRFLKKQFLLNDNDIYKVNGPVNLMRLQTIYDVIKKDDLKFKKYLPNKKNIMTSSSIKAFETISNYDFLYHHPYDSFTSIINFLKAAADDPKVISIKQTIYRVEKNSEIIKLLCKAAQSGKEVLVVVELKAKFDEEHNIKISKLLENNGVKVTYGVLGFKTHGKALLVIRRENKKLVKYTHLSTGNYNKKTAKIYTDYGLITSDIDIGNDIQNYFIQLTGSNKELQYKKIIVAPFKIGKTIISSIKKEIRNKKSGKNSKIMAKLNQLTEPKIIDYLYQASQAGVEIILFVRGECRLKPGVKNLSNNIKVYSIVGRFLEHSRVYYFHNAGSKDLYLSSADLMTRNIHNRVEIMFPIESDIFKKRIVTECFELPLKDNGNLWRLDSRGRYFKKHAGSGNKKNLSQINLCELHGELDGK